MIWCVLSKYEKFYHKFSTCIHNSFPPTSICKVSLKMKSIQNFLESFKKRSFAFLRFSVKSTCHWLRTQNKLFVRNGFPCHHDDTNNIKIIGMNFAHACVWIYSNIFVTKFLQSNVHGEITDWPAQIWDEDFELCHGGYACAFTCHVEALPLSKERALLYMSMLLIHST